MIRAILFLLLALSAWAATPLPDSRIFPWIPGSTVGVSNGIPSGTWPIWTNVIAAGADNTGASDCKALFETLLNTCPAQKVIYVPEGIYSVSGRINKNATTNYVCFRGAGWDKTIIIATNGFMQMDSQSFSYTNVRTNLSKGQTNIAVDPSANFSTYVGKTASVSCNNRRTDLDLMHVYYTDRILEQHVQIRAVSQNTNITIWPPLAIDFPDGFETKVGVQTLDQSEFIGWEGFHYTATNFLTRTPPASQNGMAVYGGRNWWWHSVKISEVNGFPINSIRGLFHQVMSCVFQQSVAGANTAVINVTGDSGWLIENCYSIGGSPFAEMNQCVGSVIAYNYATNAVSNDQMVGNPFDHHVPHSCFNLWEGNFGSMFQSDSYFGSSSDNTLHRNRFTGHDLIKTGGSSIARCVDLGRWSQRYNMEGNYLGDLTRSASWLYTVTNQYYGGSSNVIYRFGFPYPGNTSYGVVGTAFKTPETDFRFPGGTRLGGTITSATGSGTTVSGDFSAVQDGDWLVLRSESNTNFYYPLITGYPVLLASGAGSGSSLTFNQSINYTNGHTVWRIGPDAFPALTLNYTNGFLIRGNYDVANGAQINAAEYFETNSYYLPNGGARPDWWIDANGNALTWPPVNPSTPSVGDWAARFRGEREFRPQRVRGIRLRLK
jgi:hypothetical protein